MAVQLIIKSPNQQVDIKVDCDSTWTIEKLKDHLCAVYPTKPTKDQQKIIYGGRLLPDHLLLKEVITKDQNVHIMHLVCPQSTYSSKNLNEPSKVKSEEETAHLMSQPPMSTVFSSTVNPDGLRERVFDPQQYISQMNTFYSQAQLPPATMPTAFMYNPYQMAMLQQTYAQFMAQCFAQGQPINALSSYPNWTVTQPVESRNAPNVQPNVNAPAAHVRRLNETEEERFNFFDLIYVFTRMLMLTAVLYFYSTPGRIMLVLSLVTFFCLYRIGFMRSRNTRPNVPARDNEERDRNTQPESDVAAGATSDGETTSDDNQTEVQSAEGRVVPQMPPNRPSRLEIALVFVKTLFTSLIPDLPLPVDVN